MSVSSVSSAAASGPGAPQRARSPEEAAEQFQAVLVKQFVETMTKDLFKESEQAGGMSAMQADAQRDALTNALTEQLTTTDALGLRDLVTRRLTGALAAPEAQAALDAAGGLAPLPTRPPTPL